ncbi:MAG: GNAT family N-acetyltransferase [Anaeroplasmataceae bacterium]|nr:GNAT family N-acetyltransferase [Anaeroplasmataceae bacterium]MDE5868113.1 GNAT family N-acetyltransferase [Anaeroplasmataceae bacterium]
MKLVGNNIIVRNLNLKDQADYFEYGKNPNVGPNAGWKPFPSMSIAGKVLSGMILKGETYAIALKSSNKLIGTISLYSNTIRSYNKAKSLGFSLAYDYWNHGYMTEAVQLILKFSFKHTDCKIIEVGHHVGNEASKRVILKCGFTYDGRLRAFKKLYDDRLIDADFYSLTKEEYERGLKK